MVEWSVCTLQDITKVGTTGQACQPTTGVEYTGLCVTQVVTAANSSHWLRLNGIYYILLMLWLSKRKLGLYTPINTVAK